MKYYTYVLFSLVNGDLYVGSTGNLKRRLLLHNSGKVKSTKAYKPWKMLEYHAHGSRSEAVKHERFLKTHQQKEQIKKKHQDVG